MEEQLKRMRELVEVLIQASKEYYANDREVLSNYEYDTLYEELEQLERETQTTFANSPTLRVGYEAVDFLEKEAHENPMLSLDKTKEREALQDWLNEQEGILSYKLDGLTIVVTYVQGVLQKAVTRGNGEVGEVVTNNAKVFHNLPLSIPYKGNLIVRGEAVISYGNFQKINEQIEETEEKYKNPRNLCSGSVRQLNNEITATRKVEFYGFALVQMEEDVYVTREEEFAFLKEQGFSIVPYYVVTKKNLLQRIEDFAKEVVTYDIPSDGLVLCYNHIAYGISLGRTSKFPRDAIAFKWQDEVKATTLLDIEWSPSRTGLINPVAIFEPVELEGTTVSRASVHNISVMRQLELGIGDIIEVYKANMIIPQIANNLTRSNQLEIPDACPVCKELTEILQSNEVSSLTCKNPNCSAKKVKSFALLVSRNGLNMEGLSEATLTKFITKGWVKEYADLFYLEKYREEIIQMEGFGERSYRKIIKSVEESRSTTFAKFIYSIGIPNIGSSNAKMLGKYFSDSIDALLEASVEELSTIDGIGEVIGTSIVAYFTDVEKRKEFDRLRKEVQLQFAVDSKEELFLEGMVFVITGSLIQYENRDALKEEIERYGGKVTGSVTKKTTYLINNDATSVSSKNKKANDLGVPILTEEEYQVLIQSYQ